MNRRTFLKQTTLASSALLAAKMVPAAEKIQASAAKLPRWRGFNLLEKFLRHSSGSNPPFLESDFQWISDWGFDFVRLPMSYLCWTDPSDWLKIREKELEDIDQAIEWGQKYGVHLNLNFHRAPGYCVNPPKEPLDLWSDEKALAACAFHWAAFARRYRGIPNDRLSFDLLNEPPDIPETNYNRVIQRLVAAIRAEDPNRLIIADGLRWGRDPVHSLAGAQIAQSTRGYDPMQISHWKANWVHGADKWPEPEWPLRVGGRVWNKDRLRSERIAPWKKLEAAGVGVHVGEWGCYRYTPHAVALAWMRDQLELWREAGWGWALWNFRGDFGILDSQRKDVNYAGFKGHLLDREMLELLRKG